MITIENEEQIILNRKIIAMENQVEMQKLKTEEQVLHNELIKSKIEEQQFINELMKSKVEEQKLNNRLLESKLSIK